MAVSSRKVSEKTLDDRVRNVLEFVKRCSEIKGISKTEGRRDTPEARALNRKLMADSVVLLRNDNKIIPLPSDVTEIALIGPNLKNIAYSGGGSAQLEPYYTVSPYRGIVNQLTDEGKRQDVKIHYEVGADAYGFYPTLGENMKTPEGQQGYLRIRFFCEPPSVPNRETVEELRSKDSSWQMMGYGHPKLGHTFYADVECIYTPLETGDHSWGLACYGTTSLFIDGKLIIDNTTKQRSGNGFFGKGTAMETGILYMEAGKEYHVKIEFGSAATSKIVKKGVVRYGGGAGRVGCVRVFDAEAGIRRAVELAKRCKYTILCAGLNVSQPLALNMLENGDDTNYFSLM